MWYRVHYMRYRAFDGSIKIDPRPVARESTGQMSRAADQSLPPQAAQVITVWWHYSPEHAGRGSSRRASSGASPSTS